MTGQDSKVAADADASAGASPVSPEQRQAMIAETAYLRAEARGFQGGDPVADWLAAEAEVDARLAAPGKEDFLAGFEAKLAEWDRKVAGLKRKAGKAETDLREDFETRLAAFKAQRSAARAGLKAARARGEAAWDDLRSGSEQAWTDMQAAIDAMLERFK